jgi:hypothetical protein
MSKRSWFLITLIVLAILAWYFLFYKTYSKSQVAKSADMVLSIDVKRNTNTLLGYYITTPSEWDLGSIFRSDKNKKASWQSAIKIPDYIFIFHCKGQPANAYYCVLNIKNDEDFKEALKYNEFTETSGEKNYKGYVSSKLGVDIIRSGDKILVGNIAVKDKNLLYAVADELFRRKDYINSATLEKIVAPKNHFTFFAVENNFSSQPIILNGNFQNGSLTIDASIQPVSKYNFDENIFALNDQSILSLGFTQPDSSLYKLINDSSRAKISTALNFNIDSLFLLPNKKYELDIASFKNKVDSAITYTYDDDFNKIEKVIVNNIQEPSFNFGVNGENFSGLVNYWKANKNIQTNTENNQLFVSMPFVKTYVYNNDDSLALTSYNYIDSRKKQLQCIGHLNFNINKMPENLLNYLPEQISKLINKTELLNIVLKKDKQSISLNIMLHNKIKNKPFLLSFK